MFGVVPSVSLQKFLFVVSDAVSFSGFGVQKQKSTLPSASLSLSVVKTAAFVDAAEREKKNY